MLITKTLGTFIATALVGFFTLMVSSPKKISKTKSKTAKTSTQSGIEEKENLFI
ncbi:hypothetical protein C7460_1285 [Marinoscillum furvescens DSM 4134]|uniref:Uncharacterized protein n=1 Tax=Marinoscillum furvescens DSM 4134 TaxID=1122208 RepID=A0A3D9KYX2_MARFU|nr:hypothetical protein C7460_1285 [Marinoscillum furvescens DSM 4134]